MPKKSASGNTLLLANPPPALGDELLHLFRGRPERPGLPPLWRDPGRPAGAAVRLQRPHGLHQHRERDRRLDQLRAQARAGRLPLRRQGACVQCADENLQGAAGRRVAEDPGAGGPLQRPGAGVHAPGRQDGRHAAGGPGSPRRAFANTGTWGGRRTSRSCRPSWRGCRSRPFNIVYADKAGHIEYLDNGVPAQTRRGRPGLLAGGSCRATRPRPCGPRPTATPNFPKVIDPPSGYVQNTNDPPWVATLAAGDPLCGVSAPTWRPTGRCPCAPSSPRT